MTTKKQFINESGLAFTDISSEESRTYTFSNGKTYTIKNPLWLNVSANGHRVFNQEGTSFYVMTKDVVAIEWKVKEWQPNFVK